MRRPHCLGFSEDSLFLAVTDGEQISVLDVQSVTVRSGEGIKKNMVFGRQPSNPAVSATLKDKTVVLKGRVSGGKAILPRRKKDVSMIATSADGSVIATAGSFSRRAWIWKIKEDTLEPEEWWPDDELAFNVNRIHFVGDKLLVSGGNETRLWDIDKQKVVWSVDDKAFESSVSNDGSLLVVRGINTGPETRLFDIHDLSNVQETRRWWTKNASVSRDGKRIAHVVAYKNESLFWAMQPGSKLLTRPIPESGDAKILIETSAEKPLREIPIEVKGLSFSKRLAFSPDGSLLANGNMNVDPSQKKTHHRLMVWDVNTGKSLIDTKEASVLAFTFTPDNRFLVALPSLINPPPGKIQVWDLKQGKLLSTFGRVKVQCVTVTKDSRRVIGGCLDGKIRMWNLETGELLKVFEGHNAPAMSVALSSDNIKLASGSSDGEVLVWDMSTVVAESP